MSAILLTAALLVASFAATPAAAQDCEGPSPIDLSKSSITWSGMRDVLQGVDATDLDGDAAVDLVVAHWSSSAHGAVTALRSSGAGTFTPTTTANLSGLPLQIVTADFNGDGWPDAAVTHWPDITRQESEVVVYSGDGLGGLVELSRVPVGAWAHALVAGDVDNDGDIDLVVGEQVESSNPSSYRTASRHAVLFGDGDGGFTRALGRGTGTSTRNLVLADMDEDGFADLVIATSGQNGHLLVYLNDRAGRFNDHFSLVKSGYLGLSSLAVGDLDRDGRLDVAAGGWGDSGADVFLFGGRGDGTLVELPAAGLPGRSGAALISDLDGDGWPDLAVSAVIDSYLSVGRNLSGMQFERLAWPSDGNSGGGPRELVLGDFNGDGVHDLVRMSYIGFGGTLYLHLNQTVQHCNSPPVLDPLGDQSTAEGELLEFSVAASDPDVGGTLTLTASNTPTGSTFDPSTGTFRWTPGFDAAGTYPDVEFGVFDDGDPIGRDSLQITIAVSNTNRPPEIGDPGPQQAIEDEWLVFDVSATDPDNDGVTITALGIPAGASFDGTTFSWIPAVEQAGIHSVGFTATDNGTPSQSSTVEVEIAVGNHAPLLDPIGNKTGNEGEVLEFTVSATDPDVGDTLTFGAGNLPTGSSFDSSTGLFQWTPGFTDDGNYPDVEFTVTDDGAPRKLDVELITITIGNVNRAPVLSNPGPRTVVEEEALRFAISASDPDGDDVVIVASGIPAGASFDGGTFEWTPTLSQAGVYSVAFTATDNGVPPEPANLTVVITVGDNPTPIEQAEQLVEAVVVLALPNSIENSYLANLQKVEQFIASGKSQAAVNQLGAFRHKVGQDLAHGQITQVKHDNLVQLADALLVDLE